jgi:hypothetical protein
MGKDWLLFRKFIVIPTGTFEKKLLTFNRYSVICLLPYDVCSQSHSVRARPYRLVSLLNAIATTLGYMSPSQETPTDCQ